jgi:hypothetical protein
MGVYDRQVASAIRMIKEKGALSVFRSITKSSNTYEGDELTYTDYAVNIACVPVDRVDHETQMYREFTDIPVGYTLGYMGAVDFKPTMKDVVVFGGVTYTIRNIIEYNPNGESIAFVLGLMP